MWVQGQQCIYVSRFKLQGIQHLFGSLDLDHDLSEVRPRKQIVKRLDSFGPAENAVNHWVDLVLSQKRVEILRHLFASDS